MQSEDTFVVPAKSISIGEQLTTVVVDTRALHISAVSESRRIQFSVQTPSSPTERLTVSFHSRPPAKIRPEKPHEGSPPEFKVTVCPSKPMQPGATNVIDNGTPEYAPRQDSQSNSPLALWLPDAERAEADPDHNPDDGMLDDELLDDGMLDDGMLDDELLDDELLDDELLDDELLDDELLDESATTVTRMRRL
jgi:hypothetical protein